MKSIANDGKIVISTIHQPSSEVFHLFDDLLLMDHGRVVYFGTVDGAEEHFRDCGYPCPEHYNPADHYLITLQNRHAVHNLIEHNDELRFESSFTNTTCDSRLAEA